ncbi:unnamed protein product [Paramecium octaurelia]|uniref:Uncharacterized protein n=1 Tax=Paramecium octaurelia TaxID=43137 RepID=A0A8S1UYS7_PAROT|nr:unnamed protein product [Paramecium octaurelia]
MRRPQSAQVTKIFINRPKDEIIETRQQLNQLTDEHRKIKTQNMQLKRQLMRYEHIDENLINSQQLLGRASEQPSIIPTLKYKIRVQQNEIDVLRQQLQAQQKQMRVTSIQELQYQIQQYQEETVNLKQMLDEAMNIKNETQKSQYIGYLSKIQELKLEIKQYNQLCENQQRDIKQLQSQIKLQSDQLQQLNAEKKKYENQYKEPQIQKPQQMENSNIFSKSVVIKDPKKRDETPEYSANENTLLSQLQEKERKIRDLEENLTSLNKTHNAKINQQLQYIEQQNAQLGMKQNIIQNLEQEINKLELQIKDTRLKTQQMLQNKVCEDKGTQIPHKSKWTTEEIKAILRFRLKRSMIEQKDISEFLLKKGDQRFFSIQSRFQKFPFNLNAEQSYHITMFLLTEESPFGQSALEKDLPQSVLKSRISHLLPQYELLTIEEEGQLFSCISRKIINKLNQLQDSVKQIKRIEKSTIKDGFCLPKQLLEAFTYILDNSLSEKEAEYLYQLNFEITKSPILINISRIVQLFQMKPKSGISKIQKELSLFPSTLLFSYNKEAIVKPKRQSMLLNQNISPKQSVQGQQRILKLNQAFSAVEVIPVIKKKPVLSIQQILSIQLGKQKIYKINSTQTEEIELGIDKKMKSLGIEKIIELNWIHKLEKADVGVCSRKEEMVIIKQIDISYHFKKEQSKQEIQPNIEKENHNQIMQIEKVDNKQEEKEVIETKPQLNQDEEIIINQNKQDIQNEQTGKSEQKSDQNHQSEQFKQQELQEQQQKQELLEQQKQQELLEQQRQQELQEQKKQQLLQEQQKEQQLLKEQQEKQQQELQQQLEQQQKQQLLQEQQQQQQQRQQQQQQQQEQEEKQEQQLSSSDFTENQIIGNMITHYLDQFINNLEEVKNEQQ